MTPTPPRRTRLLQLVSDLSPDDAVGQQVLLWDEVARSMGAATTLVACRRSGNLSAGTRVDLLGPGGMPGVGPADLVLLHHSIGSPAADAFVQTNGAAVRLVVYHNVTPPALLADSPGLAALTHWGLRQLPAVVQAADGVLGCSRFNLSEVEALGPRRCEVVWLAPSVQRLDMLRRAAAQRAAVGRMPDVLRPRLLLVGRLVASKNLPAAILAAGLLAERHPGCQPEIRFVGPITDPGLPERLYRSAADAGLTAGAVQILGPQDLSGLTREMVWADLLIQPSLHEGFGMPPVEAMHAGLPVIGSDSGAMPEVTAGCCPLVPGADPDGLAAAMERLLTDQAAREAVIEGQTRHAGQYLTPEIQSGNLQRILREQGLGQ